MVIKISQKTLMKTLDDKGDRIVLGGIDWPVASGCLVIWSAWFVLVMAMLKIGGRPQGGLVPMLVISAALCYLVVAFRRRLTLDIPSRTYLRESGFYPFIVTHRGSLDEFDHLDVALHSGFTNRPGNDFFIQLVPKSDAPPSAPGRKPASTGKPLTLAIATGLPGPPKPNEMQEVAMILGQTVGLPLQVRAQTDPGGG